MKRLVMPFLMCLRREKFKPDETFTGVDELEGLTIELAAQNESNAELIKQPDDNAELKFIITAGPEVVSSTEFKMSQVFETKIEFTWNDKQYQVSFK
ncbi:hypothetical protein MOO44_08455 [Nicoliella spurrieriana]|uniref:Uncharacterized protein n=1 Tax=Nicoliella spurrieriana TaxID=2925830 RepID=A0A976X5G6_9LACO|nr:hypothetical protein [Nicoliella spurrieriana]UQS86880.1 hypothetical protein MOO44_08455 [Nicoliella spurrieriana]